MDALNIPQKDSAAATFALSSSSSDVGAAATGDHTPMSTWTILGIIAAVGVLIFIVYRYMYSKGAVGQQQPQQQQQQQQLMASAPTTTQPPLSAPTSTTNDASRFRFPYAPQPQIEHMEDNEEEEGGVIISDGNEGY